MALMISLDDAMEVLIRGGYIDEGYIDDDGNAELVRSELEQKCYMIQKHKDAKWTDHIAGEIDEVMNVHSIAKHIENGTLNNWLESHKDVAMSELELLAKQMTQRQQ